MNRDNLRWMRQGRGRLTATLALLLAAGFAARADVVELQNGDRYVGQVLSLSGQTLVLQSEVLGKVALPRARVSLIALGANAVTNLARVRPPPPQPAGAPLLGTTNSRPGGSMDLRQLGLSTNLIQQVQKQYLGDAAPEAKDKFNELMAGLSTGKLNLEDIRSQAQAAADQIQSLKKEMGPDAGGTLDAYLGILQHFLKETESSVGASTNAPASSP